MVPTIYVLDPDETIEQTIERLAKETGHRHGPGRAIELMLAEFSTFLEQRWNTIVPGWFKSSWLPQLENHEILEEVPDIGPSSNESIPENYLPSTPDSGQTPLLRTSIRYKPVREENAGFARKMFSNNKELKPRLRYYIITPPREPGGPRWATKVMARTSEHLYEFDIWARNYFEMTYFYKVMQYIFWTNQKILIDLGIQRAIVLGSPRSPRLDKETKMHVRTLSVYLRTEEFFYEEAVPEIHTVQLNWDDVDTGFSN
jgi:hypothetical protein